MDYISWKRGLIKDAETLELLALMIADIKSNHDKKLKFLLELILKKQLNPMNEGNKKLLIFTAFSDTADDLYDNVSRFVIDEFGLITSEVTGTVEGRTTIKKFHGDLNTVLTCFSPLSKGKDVLMPNNKG